MHQKYYPHCTYRGWAEVSTLYSPLGQRFVGISTKPHPSFLLVSPLHSFAPAFTYTKPITVPTEVLTTVTYPTVLYVQVHWINIPSKVYMRVSYNRYSFFPEFIVWVPFFRVFIKCSLTHTDAIIECVAVCTWNTNWNCTNVVVIQFYVLVRLFM